MQDQTPVEPISGKSSFSLVEAAAVTGLSRVTIRRYLDAGKFPNATRDTSTPRRPPPWRIPPSDLIALGLTIREPETEHQPASGPPPQVVLDEYRIELLVELATHRTAASERQRVIETLLASNHRLLELVERLATGPNDRQPPRPAAGLLARSNPAPTEPAPTEPAPTEPAHENRKT